MGDMRGMSAAMSILVIDENHIRASIIEAGLREAGHQRVSVVHDVKAVAQRIGEIAPDVIIIDLENPNRDTLEHFFSLSKAIQRPIAMFVDRSDGTMIDKAVQAGVSAYVVDGMKKERIKPIMDMAIARFNAFARLERELEQAKGELEDRKIIEKAKGILMKTRGLSESEAYQLLRTSAMNRNQRLIDIAQSLITASELLGPDQ